MVLVDQLALHFDIIQEKTQKTLASNFSQTDRYTIVHRGNQSRRFRHALTQTEDCIQASERPQVLQTYSVGLLTFLERVTPIFCEQLQRNCKSSVWRNVQAVDIVNEVEPFAQTVHFEQATSLEHSVTCVAWNTFGTIFAVAYGQTFHEHWCTHTSYLVLWNICKESLRSDAPDYVFEITSCVNCVAFRPQHSSILACGTFSGELMIWTLANELGSLVASRGGALGGHQDAINYLHWLTPESGYLGASKSGRSDASEHIISFGADGRIICWTLTMDSREPSLTPVKIYQICGRDQLRAAVQDRLCNASSWGGTQGGTSTSLDHPIGVSTAVFSPHNPESLFIGTESGGLLFCKFKVVDWNVPRIEQTFDHRFPSPVSFSLARFSAPIHCVSWSPFHRNLVAASGAFQGVHIFNVLERTRLMVIDSGEGQIFSIKFSPYEPFYILAGAEAGSILLFDLRGSIQAGFGTQITPNPNTTSIYTSLTKKFELAKRSEKESNAVMSLAFNDKMWAKSIISNICFFKEMVCSCGRSTGLHPRYQHPRSMRTGLVNEEGVAVGGTSGRGLLLRCSE